MPMPKSLRDALERLDADERSFAAEYGVPLAHPHYETAAAQQRREARERAERDAQAYLAAQRDRPQPRRVWHIDEFRAVYRQYS